MIERNRNTDKDEIDRLESKIKALESDIVTAKQLGEERRLDKLEQSLTNTSVPALADTSLLDDDEGSPMKQLLSDKLELIATSGKQKTVDQHDSVLQEDELAILADYDKRGNVKGYKDVILEYDEYEK